MSINCTNLSLIYDLERWSNINFAVISSTTTILVVIIWFFCKTKVFELFHVQNCNCASFLVYKTKYMKRNNKHNCYI